MLVGAAGKYLRNPVRDPDLTCRVCTSPTFGQPRCNPCADAANMFEGLADLVVPLSYSIGSGPSAKVLRHYKDDPDPKMRAYCTNILAMTMQVGLDLHRSCMEQHAGKPISMILFVPSTRGLRDFADLATDLGAVDLLKPVQGDTETSQSGRLVVGHRPTKGDRTVTRHRFVLDGDVRGQHVLILDDSWTTGANAQSCALTVRAAGAAAVTVVVAGRRLNLGWSTDWPADAPAKYRSNRDFVRRYLNPLYDPYLCPVTGSTCGAESVRPAENKRTVHNLDPTEWWT